MAKINCWEFKKCGRQPGGNMVDELGVCPAAVFDDMKGVNGGLNGGRCCWIVAGTFCAGKVEGTFAQKIDQCMSCDFFNKVLEEENGTITHTGKYRKRHNSRGKTRELLKRKRTRYAGIR